MPLSWPPSVRLIPLGLFMLCAAVLAAVLVSQYEFELYPCKLCYWQRVPYVMVGVLALGAVGARQKHVIWWLVLIAMVAFTIGGGIAFYHMGVEYHWFEGPDTCSGGSGAATLEELRQQILSAPNVRCDEPAFVFLGLSMAGWNLVLSLILVWGCVMILRRWNRWYGKETSR